MPETFNCPNCGAPLDYKGSDPIIRCPYCNSSVVVPENLRAKPEFSSQPSNYTFSGIGNMGGLINQARRFKEVKDLARAGDMDEAVRVYCEITGVSPEMARPSVEALANGQPITLTGLNMGDMMGAVRMATEPSISIKPVDEKTSKGIARGLGCGIGCFVAGLVTFILITTLVPALGAAIGMAVGINPELIPNLVSTAEVSNIPVIENIPTFPPATPQPSPTPGFANIVMSFGDKGTGPGFFNDERSIAIDAGSGKLYVAEYQGGRVQAFDASGKFISQWMVGDKKTIIRGMSADRKGNVFIVTGGKILRYNGEGKLQSTISGGGKQYDKVVARPDGNLTAISNGEDLVHLSVAGKILGSIPKAISTISGDTELDSSFAIDGQGNIYILGTFNKAVFKFGPDGKYLNRFGGAGDQPGQFTGVGTIAVDGQGRIYISDFKGIQVFDPDGRFLDVIDVEGAVFGMVFDDENNLYATSNVDKVFKFSISK
jgi:sugar lactone lactonase YvrE/DNA-directed RNA polymerase subunit RPC12/RpoP